MATGEAPQSSVKRRTLVDMYRDNIPKGIRYMMLSMAFIFPLLASFISIIYCLVSYGGWRGAALALMTGGAGLMVGMFFGFLFAVPRVSVLAGTTEGTEHSITRRSPHIPNSNLEQVSDWLTKILIGISLVQFDNVLRGLTSVADAFAGKLGRDPSADRLMATAILVFFPVFGFLCSYLGTRTMVTIMFDAVENPDNDRDP